MYMNKCMGHNIIFKMLGLYFWRFQGKREKVWYLIVSIPDLCTLTYFDKSRKLIIL